MAFEDWDDREKNFLVLLYRLVNNFTGALEALEKIMFIPKTIAEIVIVHQRQCRDCQDLLARYTRPVAEPSEQPEQRHPVELSPEDQALIYDVRARYEQGLKIEKMAGHDHIFTQIKAVELDCATLKGSLIQCKLFLRHLNAWLPPD